MSEFESVGPKGYTAHILDKVTGNRGTIEHDMFWYYIDSDGNRFIVEKIVLSDGEEVHIDGGEE